jgi:hypothetical protein
VDLLAAVFALGVAQVAGVGERRVPVAGYRPGEAVIGPRSSPARTSAWKANDDTRTPAIVSPGRHDDVGDLAVADGILFGRRYSTGPRREKEGSDTRVAPSAGGAHAAENASALAATEAEASAG